MTTVQRGRAAVGYYPATQASYPGQDVGHRPAVTPWVSLWSSRGATGEAGPVGLSDTL